MEQRARVFLIVRVNRSVGWGKTRKTSRSTFPLSSFQLFSAFGGDQPLKLTPEIAAATLRSAAKTLHGSSGGAALPFALLSVDSQASTATVRVSRQKKSKASNGSYTNSLDPVAALVASLACVTRSPQLVLSSSSRGGEVGVAAAAPAEEERTLFLPPQPLALSVVRRCPSAASLASDPRSFDPCTEIEEAAVDV